MEKNHEGYNKIREWLVPLLRERRVSVEWLARRTGVSRTIIYNYLRDVNRPTSRTMLGITRALGVPFEEGLKQYTENKLGAPRGSRTTRRELVVRHTD